MKRLALVILLAIGASRGLAHRACSDEPRGAGPEPEAPVAAAPAEPRGAGELAPKAPEWYRDALPAKHFKGDPTNLPAIKGELSISRDRALRNAREQFEHLVSDWLSRDRVPGDWKAPRSLINRLILASHVEPVVRDNLDIELDEYPVWYEGAYRLDFSQARKAEILAAYGRDVAQDRMKVIAGIIAFVLACLAALAAYIRADEATKGYYTNKLRLAAAAAVGAAGVAAYRFFV
jgi:hypothetical protein